MKTTYVIIGLVIFAAAIAIVYVLSQPRPVAPGAAGTAAQGGSAASTFAGIWGGLGAVGTSIAGAAES